MLKLLRQKKTAKKIYYVLAIIIIPAFVAWGSISRIERDKDPRFAGTIFGKKVSFDEFRDGMRAWKTQIKLQYGEKADEIIKTFYNPTQATWDRLIILHEAKRRKIKVTDAEVVDRLTSMPFLQKNGRFNQGLYDLFLKYSLNESPRQFEEQLRENLLIAKLFEDVTKNVLIEETQIMKEYKKQNEKVRIKYVMFLNDGYKDTFSPAQEELETYYEGSKNAFRIPDQINVEYIAAELKDDASDEEKKTAQDKMETASVLSQEKTLKETAEQLKLPWEETGLFASQDPIPTIGWMPPFSNYLFSLPKGQNSPIVDMGKGLYLFRIKERKDAYLPDFQEARENVKEAFLKKKSKETARQKAEALLTEVREAKTLNKESLSFEKIAKKQKLKVEETPLFTYEDDIPELGTALPLKDIIFKLEVGDVTKSVIELTEGFCCAELIEHVPVDEEKFKEEKTEFGENILDEKKNQLFNEFFVNLKERANLVSFLGASASNKNKNGTGSFSA